MLSKRLLATAVVSFACASCATLNESECRTGNWRQIGYTDGLKGYAKPRLVEHQEACAEYTITADTTAWKLGYAEGLVQYCTVPNGYIVGRDGQSYADVCPPDLDAGFRPAYKDGERIAALLNQLNEINSEISGITTRLDDDERRADAYLDAVRSGHKPDKRPDLMSREERRRLKHDSARLDSEYARNVAELERKDADYSAKYGVSPLEPVQRDY